MAVAACLLHAVGAAAQTNERLYEGLDFRFVTPGARAVGMGVTFVGVADDATAAASNPAGLSNLRRPEFSVEVSASESSQSYLVGNQQNGRPCDVPCDRFQKFGRTSWSLPSFASVAVPAGDFTLAAFMNVQQRFTRRFDLEPRYVQARATPFGTLGPSGQTAESGRLDVSVRNYGLGGAWVARPWLSVGGTLVVSHLDLESRGENIEDGILRSRTTTAASGLRPSVFAGALARPTRHTTVGLAFYRGTTFPMRTEIAGTFGNPPGASPPDRCLNQSFQRPERQCEPHPALETDYVVPSRLAVGGAFRASAALTLAGEVARVGYSSLVTDHFQIVDFRFAGGLEKDNFFVKDVREYHVGAEYRHRTGEHVVALRAGAFSDPPHGLRFKVTNTSSAQAVQNFVFNTNARQTTRIGATVGLGVTFGNRLQTDAAVSLVPGASRLVVSVVRRVP
ncbi:MAG: OmpP1/FadL family transporter [Vicinamibacterales bacterium]